MSSFNIISKSSRILAFIALSSIGHAISTLFAVFLVIISALEIYKILSSPTPKAYTLECSKYLPTIPRISILSVLSLIPGIIQQIPRIIIFTVTPAFEALAILSMILLSVNEFIFIKISAG